MDRLMISSPPIFPVGRLSFVRPVVIDGSPAGKSPVANLYQCDGDGRNIQALSSNAETESTPSVLHDGRVLYTRWEYVDRSQLCYHHLWTTRADGMGQMTFYGNMLPTGKQYALSQQNANRVQYQNVPGAVAMLDSKPIPGSEEIVSIFLPGHGRKGHQGYVTLVDPRTGPGL